MKRKLGQFDKEYQARKTREQYEKGMASFKIDPKKTSLIVVDMVDEFTKPNWSPCWIPMATEQMPKIRKLIDLCRDLDVPIIYTYYAFRPDYLDMSPPFREGWTPADILDDYDGPPLFQKESVDPALKPKYGKDILLAKPCYGAFSGTSLDYILKNLKRDSVIICGTATNYCCGTTAREAHAHGYRVVFGSDINSTDNQEMQDAELKTLRRGFALVITEEEIEEMLREKGPYVQKT
jgi:nicotinamidase-related amidase